MCSIKSGFITPDYQRIEMDYFEVGDFCKEICLRKEHQTAFYEFARDYTYFQPYFDFVMSKLDYAFINPLLEEHTYLKLVNHSFYKVEEEKLLDLYGKVSYDTITDMARRYQNRYSDLVMCSDSELHIKQANIHDSYSILLDPNGYSIISTRDEKEGNHEVTANTIANQLFINNKELVNNYHHKVYFVNYLIEKFGFVRITSLKHGGLMIGMKEFLTEPQKKFCDLCEESGGVFVEYDENHSIQEEKRDYGIRR